jgi:LEA14-like dessication related protein
MKRTLLAAAAAGVLILGTAGSTAASAAKKNIAVSLSKKEIREMDGTGLTLVFYLEIRNSSRLLYDLTQYDFRVVVQGTDYFALKTTLESAIVVPREDKILISLPIKITYADLLERVPGAAGSSKLPCYVTGLLIFADSRKKEEKVPFAFSGEFPIFKDLEILIQPLEVKTLTIGGTEFTFAFACRNGNSFDLTLENLAYRLAIEDRTISEGVIKGANQVAGGGEKTFSFPIMLDFFEVGRELFDLLKQPSVACELSGETRAESLWGEIRILFSKKESVKILAAGQEETRLSRTR